MRFILIMLLSIFSIAFAQDSANVSGDFKLAKAASGPGANKKQGEIEFFIHKLGTERKFPVRRGDNVKIWTPNGKIKGQLLSANAETMEVEMKGTTYSTPIKEVYQIKYRPYAWRVLFGAFSMGLGASSLGLMVFLISLIYKAPLSIIWWGAPLLAAAGLAFLLFWLGIKHLNSRMVLGTKWEIEPL